MASDSDLKLLKKIATPVRLANEASPDLLAQPFEVFKFTLFLERKILEAYRAPGKRGLVINLPPQVGKTSLMMWILAWIIMMNPSTRAAFISYSQSYSSSWGKRVRTIVQHLAARYFGCTIDRDNSSANDWGMEGTTGGLLSVGIDGGITGRSIDVGVVDDVIKNMDEATSEATLKGHWREFMASVVSRVQDDGLLIVTATRWSPSDISGRLIEMIEGGGLDVDEPGGGDEDTEAFEQIEWEYINIQAIAEPPDDVKADDEERAEWSDVLGRKEGEELECRFRPGHWRGQRNLYIKAGDPYGWRSLYQGDPIVLEGSSFPPDKWGRIDINELDNVHSRIRVWDLAATAGAGDWTVSELWGKWGEYLVVLEVTRFRKSGEEVWDEVLTTSKADGTAVPIYMERERSGSGVALCDLYKKAMPNHLVEGIRPDGTKFTRAKTYAQLQNRGKILLPEGATWIPAWEREHGGMMPDGRMPRYDDQIDCGSYAIQKLVEYDESILVIPQDIIDRQNGWTQELAHHHAATIDQMLSGVR